MDALRQAMLRKRTPEQRAAMRARSETALASANEAVAILEGDANEAEAFVARRIREALNG